MSTKGQYGLPLVLLTSTLGLDDGWIGLSLGTNDAIVLIHSINEKIFL